MCKTKSLKKCFLISIAVLIGALDQASAQTGPPVWNPTITNTVSWPQSSQNTDGSVVLPGEITANTVYRGTKADGSDATQLKLISPAATTYADSSASAGTWCYQITATGTFLVNGSPVSKESAKTNAACVTDVPPPPPAPKPPTNPITIASTVYTIIKAQDRLVMLPVGTVPAGTICDPNQAVIGDGVSYYAVPAASVSWSGNVRPPVVVSKCNG